MGDVGEALQQVEGDVRLDSTTRCGSGRARRRRRSGVHLVAQLPQRAQDVVLGLPGRGLAAPRPWRHVAGGTRSGCISTSTRSLRAALSRFVSQAPPGAGRCAGSSWSARSSSDGELQLGLLLRARPGAGSARGSARSCPPAPGRSCTGTRRSSGRRAAGPRARTRRSEGGRGRLVARAPGRRRTAAAGRGRRSRVVDAVVRALAPGSARAGSCAASASGVRRRGRGRPSGAPRADLAHQLVHVLELAQRRPARVARAPVGARGRARPRRSRRSPRRDGSARTRRRGG